MKITNIFKVGALLLAVGMFAGCAVEEDDLGMLDEKNDINYFNSESSGYARALKYAGTGDSDEVLVQVDFSGMGSSGTSGGTVGIIFDAEKADGGNGHNLCIVGIKVENGNPYAYISRFTNVSLEGGNSQSESGDLPAANGNGVAEESQYLKGTDKAAYAAISGVTASDGKLSIVVNIGRTERGEYSIAFYNAKSINNKELSSNPTRLIITGTSADGSGATISGNVVTVNDTNTASGRVGRYACVRAQSNLTAHWEFYKGTHAEAEEFVEE